MRCLVAQWNGGESRASFARRHHIPPWTFWYWCRKLSAGPTEASDTPSATFVTEKNHAQWNEIDPVSSIRVE
jgi:hypothetical protein